MVGLLSGPWHSSFVHSTNGSKHHLTIRVSIQTLTQCFGTDNWPCFIKLSWDFFFPPS